MSVTVTEHDGGLTLSVEGKSVDIALPCEPAEIDNAFQKLIEKLAGVTKADLYVAALKATPCHAKAAAKPKAKKTK